MGAPITAPISPASSHSQVAFNRGAEVAAGEESAKATRRSAEDAAANAAPRRRGLADLRRGRGPRRRQRHLDGSRPDDRREAGPGIGAGGQRSQAQAQRDQRAAEVPHLTFLGRTNHRPRS
jgi:hypothetical protein